MQSQALFRIRSRVRIFTAIASVFVGNMICFGDSPDEAKSVQGRSVQGRSVQGRSVQAASSQLQVRDGYTVTAIASEPLIADPVSAKFDYRGRLWVVEMPGYPLGSPDGKPHGRIKILKDTDSDGVMDNVVVFAKNLPFATGIQPYRDGAFVTEAGRIVFMRDTDGDLVADQTDELFKGFAAANQQLRANHPTLGPDGMIYVAGGLRGGKIMVVSDRYDQHEAPVDLRDRDFCFDPEGGRWFAVAGKSQFGLSIDDFGRRVGCSNRNPSMTTPLTLEAIDRDPLLTPRDAIHDIGAAGEKSMVKPIGDAWTTSHLHSGQFSAACGVCAVGLTEGREFILTCEPTSYLVQRQFVAESGSAWESKREEKETEFLASSSTWFRPVDALAGPSDSILIVDMARAVVEHPDFMPVELKKRADLRDGTDMGRIWRISKTNRDFTTQAIHNTDQAITWLTSMNPWMRAKASSYLLQNQSDDSIKQLKSVIRKGSPAVSAARAAQVLQRFGKLNDQDCQALMQSDQPRLQAMGVELADGRKSMLGATLTLASSPHALVRRAVAATAVKESSKDQNTVAALKSIVENLDGDKWTRRTLQSAPDEMVAALCRLSLKTRTNDTELVAHLIERFSSQDPTAAASVISGYQSESNDISAMQISALLAWTRGVRRKRLTCQAALQKVLPTDRIKLEIMAARCLDVALDVKAETQLRSQCVELVGQFKSSDDRMRELLAENQPPELRVASFDVLLRLQRDWTRKFFLSELNSMTSGLRAQAVQSLTGSTVNATWLMQKIEAGAVPKQVVDPSTTKRLRKHPDKTVRALATKLFQPNASRAAVIEKYAVAAKNLGDAHKGKKLFSQHCSACHKIDGVGTNVGPDISDSRRKTPEYLLASILDPNAAIDAAFMQYTALTDDGQIVEGLLINETAQSITLAQKGGKQVTLDRDQIERFHSPGVSLMPEGFEQNVDVQAMADLLSYLKSWRYLTTVIPGAVEALKSGR